MEENQAEHTEKTASLIDEYKSLNPKQRTFLDCYIETGDTLTATKKAGYSVKGYSVNANRLLNLPKCKDYLEKRGKIVEDHLKSIAILNGITKENTLMELWSIVKNSKKDSDKVASASQISKMLGWTKEAEQKTTFFQQIIQESSSNDIQYKKPTVISPCSTDTNSSNDDNV